MTDEKRQAIMDVTKASLLMTHTEVLAKMNAAGETYNRAMEEAKADCARIGHLLDLPSRSPYPDDAKDAMYRRCRLCAAFLKVESRESPK